jgi:hypothetical protein
MISWADVTARGAELSAVPLATQTAILEDVEYTLNVTVWGDKFTMAAAYLAAHLGTVYLAGAYAPGGPISSEATAQVSRSYSVPQMQARAEDYQSTSYGRRFDALVKQLPQRWGVL